MNNYPDDIRTFDHHPGSPFYDDGSEAQHEEDICAAVDDLLATGHHEQWVLDDMVAGIVEDLVANDCHIIARFISHLVSDQYTDAPFTGSVKEFIQGKIEAIIREEWPEGGFE